MRPGRVRSPRIVIVGAGMSGICAAIRLKRAGFDDFTILEKAEGPGGTWRDNRYPGLTCDVPSLLYQYSFDRVGTWRKAFADRDQIDEYFRASAERNGLTEHVRYGAEVVSAIHDGERWRVTTGAGEVLEADFVLFATGVLHHPVIPDIAGRDDFAGRLFHSARWDDDLDVTGKRIAVVGSGSTGVQLVSALAGRAAQVSMIARSPQWVLPVPSSPIPAPLRRALERSDVLNRWTYNAMSLVFAVMSTATERAGFWRSAIALACRLNLRTVRDRELRSRLTPDWQPLCKRLVMHPNFYQQVQRPGVSVVTDDIDHIEARGIVTSDGRLHDCDVIVMATGFASHNYMRPMRIEAGLTSLAEVWRDGPQAYRSVSIPGLPNMFMLMGPHSPIGNFSLIAVAEAQTNYILAKIDDWARGRFQTCAPSVAAMDDYNDFLRRAMPGTVWVTGCDSWYLGKNGLPELWPFRPAKFVELMHEPDGANIEFDAPATMKNVVAP